PLDRDGRAIGPTQSFPTKGPVYELSVVGTPMGDVMLSWMELTSSSDFAFFVQALAPDGQKRGPATLLKTTKAMGTVHALVESSGRRALVLFAGGEGGVRAMPLTCVP